MIEQVSQMDAFHSLNLIDVIANFIVSFFNPNSTSAWATFTHDLAIIFGGLLSKLHLFSLILSFLLFLGILYTEYKMGELKEEDKKKWKLPPAESSLSRESTKTTKNARWDRVVVHSDSDSKSDWRLAILEADIMLDELLDSKGYPGQSIGDKLKSVEAGDFQSLDAAWEAHKIRNAIAHEGGDFELSQRETRRVVELYRKVFNEFNFI
ncbi:MAG: hypothetical protein WCW14_00690 [Candidatus Paceibacterota bacterium]|jgi:hypothetical protein